MTSNDATIANRRFYEAFALEYEEIYRPAVHGKRAEAEVATCKHLIDKVRSERGWPEASTLLDLGCGPGYNLLEWARAGFAVAGLDASPSMLNLAAGRLETSVTSTYGVDLYCADVLNTHAIAPLAAHFEAVVAHRNFVALFHPADLGLLFENVRSLGSNRAVWLFDHSSAMNFGPSRTNEVPVEVERYELLDGSCVDLCMRRPPGRTDYFVQEWSVGRRQLTERFWIHDDASLNAAAEAAGWTLVQRQARATEPALFAFATTNVGSH